MALSAIVNGVTYSLDDGTYCYWLGDDGLGMSPMHRLSERGPLQHGDTDRGYRLDPRIVSLVLDINGSSQANMEAQRLTLLSIFKPSNTPIILQNVRAGGTYNLDCYYVGGMSISSADRNSWNQKVMVTLKANDPTWYDPIASSYVVSIGAGADTMLVPTVIPMTVGASTINANGVAVNSGTMIAYPVIHIIGPIVDCVITNNTTGEVLDFTGTTIEAAHYFDVDLRYGYKTITDNHSANRISTLSDDSDLVSWHLAIGDNSITVTGTSATAATGVSLVWFKRYIGI